MTLERFRYRQADNCLLQAARVRIGTSDFIGCTATGFVKSGDFKGLISRAGEHCATGLLYWALSQQNWKSVPESLRAEVTEVYSRQLAHNHYVARELGKIAEALEGLRFLVIKGLALGAGFYHDIGIRPTADIDLLVNRDELEAYKGRLAPLGYYPRKDFEEKVRLYCNSTFERDGVGGVPVETHWTLSRNFPSVTDDSLLWKDTETVAIAGRKYKTFSATMHLLHASLHVAHHTIFGWQPSLMWLTDVALLSMDASVSWKVLAEVSERFGYSRAVYLAVDIARRLLGGDFPPEARESLGKDAGSIPAILDSGMLDGLPLWGVPTPMRHMLAASFQGKFDRRVRYLAKHWVKPALRAVGIKRN